MLKMLHDSCCGVERRTSPRIRPAGPAPPRMETWSPWEPQTPVRLSILTMTKKPIIPVPYAGQWALMRSCRRELVGRSTGHARWAHTTLSELATNPQVLGGLMLVCFDLHVASMQLYFVYKHAKFCGKWFVAAL